MTARHHAQSKSRVLLVDDHAIVRQGLAELINDQPDLITCGEADSPPQATKVIPQAKPHVAIVDIALNSGDGIELCRQIHEQWPSIAILVLSMHDEGLYAERALRAGAMVRHEAGAAGDGHEGCPPGAWGARRT